MWNTYMKQGCRELVTAESREPRACGYMWGPAVGLLIDFWRHSDLPSSGFLPARTERAGSALLFQVWPEDCATWSWSPSGAKGVRNLFSPSRLCLFLALSFHAVRSINRNGPWFPESAEKERTEVIAEHGMVWFFGLVCWCPQITGSKELKAAKGHRFALWFLPSYFGTKLYLQHPKGEF